MKHKRRGKCNKEKGEKVYPKPLAEGSYSSETQASLLSEEKGRKIYTMYISLYTSSWWGE